MDFGVLAGGRNGLKEDRPLRDASQLLYKREVRTIIGGIGFGATAVLLCLACVIDGRRTPLRDAPTRPS